MNHRDGEGEKGRAALSLDNASPDQASPERSVVVNLDGRCGTCGFFRRMSTNDQGVGVGECMLGCWPAPLRATSTCAHHKPVGTPWTSRTLGGSQKGRRGRSGAAQGPVSKQEILGRRPPIPEEIDFDMDQDEFRSVLREVLLDELGVRDAEVDLGERWQGGEVVLVPGREGTQEKRIPLDAFFHKIVMVREKLRLIEQKINAHSGLSDADKVQLQQYVTNCYGSLTTFNVLFRSKEAGFVGSSKKSGS